MPSSSGAKSAGSSLTRSSHAFAVTALLSASRVACAYRRAVSWSTFKRWGDPGHELVRVEELARLFRGDSQDRTASGACTWTSCRGPG